MAFIRCGVLVSGWPAFALARLVTRHCRGELEDLPPDLRLPLEEALAELEEAGRLWAAEVRGTAEPRPEVTELPSEGMSTRQAAEALGCSDRFVRRLVAAGALPARRTKQGWIIDPGAVAARCRQRR